MALEQGGARNEMQLTEVARLEALGCPKCRGKAIYVSTTGDVRCETCYLPFVECDCKRHIRVTPQIPALEGMTPLGLASTICPRCDAGDDTSVLPYHRLEDCDTSP